MRIYISIRKNVTAMAVVVLTVAAMVAPVSAQSFQPYKLVDGHTAGVLPKSTYDLEFKFYPSGSGGYSNGLMAGMHVGITNRFNLGLSYGGEGLIGRGDSVRWNGLPGVLVKYRLFEERFATPALAIGFDNQGYGGIADAGLYGYDGYVFKSPGFFASLSKNFLMLNVVQIGFHGTVNYSLEEASEVNWPNFLVGMDIGINEELALVIEYDLAGNDISGGYIDKYFRPFHGFLNLGLRWAFAQNFHMELQFKDVMENKTRIVRPQQERESIGWSRELKIVYIGHL